MTAVAILTLTALVVAAIVGPRLRQLGTATTDGGGAALLAVGVLVAVAAICPLTALALTETWKPVAVSAVALVLGSALVLSFTQRDGSDGLFLFPLLIGASVVLAVSAVLTLRLRRRATSE
jgi:hypothetical protein